MNSFLQILKALTLKVVFRVILGLITNYDSNEVPIKIPIKLGIGVEHPGCIKL